MTEIKPGTVLNLEAETPRADHEPREGRCFKCSQPRLLFAFWVDTMPWEDLKPVWLCSRDWSGAEQWCESRRGIWDFLPQRTAAWDSFDPFAERLPLGPIGRIVPVPAADPESAR